MDKVPIMTMTALKKFRDSNGLKGVVQIHHIIPKSCYFLLSGDFTIKLNNPNNLLLMPSNKNVFKDCIIHSGPHKKYNNFVKEELLHIKRDIILLSFVFYLRNKLEKNEKNIPWN